MAQRHLPPATVTSFAVTLEARTLMGLHQLSQAELAAAIDRGQSYISARMRGTHQWSVDDIHRLAHHFAGQNAGAWLEAVLERHADQAEYEFADELDL